MRRGRKRQKYLLLGWMCGDVELFEVRSLRQVGACLAPSLSFPGMLTKTLPHFSASAPSPLHSVGTKSSLELANRQK